MRVSCVYIAHRNLAASDFSRVNFPSRSDLFESEAVKSLYPLTPKLFGLESVTNDRSS